MKRPYLLLLLSLFCVGTYSSGLRKIPEIFCIDKKNVPEEKPENKAHTILYTIAPLHIDTLYTNGEVYHKCQIKGFYPNAPKGAPSILGYTELLPVKTSAPSFSVDCGDFEDFYNISLIPSSENDDESKQEFKITKDKNVYDRNEFYPKNIVELVDTQKYRGKNIGLFRIHPFQYNPVTNVLRYYKKIKIFSNDIDATSSSISHVALYSANNGNTITSHVRDKYIIVTVNSLVSGIDEFIEWKKELGYDVDIITKANWNTSDEIRDSISNVYNHTSEDASIHLMIIGSISKVPSEIIIRPTKMYVSDHFYTCMEGEHDYWPDMTRGRIPVSYASEARSVLNKIINYEKTPSFLGRAMHVGYFETDSSATTIENSSHISCLEHIRTGLIGNAYPTIDRVYYADYNTNPLVMRTGDSIPAELRRPTYSWDNCPQKFNNYANAGVDYILYRGHGQNSGWGNVNIQKSNLQNITYEGKEPFVISSTCLTGQFGEIRDESTAVSSLCFASYYLTHSNAIGVMAFSEKVRTSKATDYTDGVFSYLYPEYLNALENYNYISPFIPPNTNKAGYAMLTGFKTLINRDDLNIENFTRNQQPYYSILNEIQECHLFGDPGMELCLGNGSNLSVCYMDQMNDTIRINTDGISDCTIQLLPLNDNDMYTKYTNVQQNLSFERPSFNFRALITKKNSTPYWISKIKNLILQNRTYTESSIYNADSIKIGYDVSEESHVGRVILNSNSNLEVYGDKIVIKNGFTCKEGAIFTAANR